MKFVSGDCVVMFRLMFYKFVWLVRVGFLFVVWKILVRGLMFISVSMKGFVLISMISSLIVL